MLPRLSQVLLSPSIAGFTKLLIFCTVCGTGGNFLPLPNVLAEETTVAPAEAAATATDTSATDKPTPATPPNTAAEAAKAAQEAAEQERRRRDVAIALNYCRASFHRIRKYPTHAVMQEEQQKILNNLNLNGIKDEQIIRLYAEVLDEIGQVELTDKETDLFDTKFKRSVRQELAFDSLAIGLDLLTGQYIGAVRTGANSWWDYRNFKWNRDHEVLKLEKNRVNSVVKKSTSFLDTFWRLTQSNNIPDRWLIRSTDLDDLEMAMNERDHHIRLRILKRMEPYMECYPPYWYYLARSQQAIGELASSLDTYQRLTRMADGHFRRDDMLASAMTNQAVIQAHLGDANAIQTAQQALTYSTQVWEANLACARILQQAGQHHDAEDAILRNLDVGLEEEQSTVSLLSFYYETHNTTKLAEYLGRENVIARIPPPVLIRYASRLNEEETSGVIWTALAGSMRVEPQVGYGPDHIILTCHPVWRIGRSKIGLQLDGGRVVQGEFARQGDYDVVRFANVADFGSVLSGPTKLPNFKLQIQYGDVETIQLAFSESATPTQTARTMSSPHRGTVTARAPAEQRSYALISAQWGEQQLALVPGLQRTAELTPEAPLTPTPPQTPAQSSPLTPTASPESAPLRAFRSEHRQITAQSTANLGGRLLRPEIKTANDDPQTAQDAADSLIR